MCFLSNYKRIAALHNFTYKITRQTNVLAAEQIAKQQRKNLKLFKFIMFFILKSLSWFMYNPMKAYIFNREFLLLMPMEIMFTDHTQLSGFLIANAIMAVMGVYVVAISLFISFHFYAIILNYAIQVDLIEADVKQLDAFWSDTSTNSLLERHLLLRNICQKCQDKD